MGRPRKDRIGEYAGLLGAELRLQISADVQKTITEAQRVYEAEIAKLRSEIRSLTRRLEALGKKSRPSKSKIGKWVPGGPGRPPKDAVDRITAFSTRQKSTKKPKRRATRKT